MEKPTQQQQPQQQQQQQRHILFELSPLDAVVEEIEEKTRRSYQNVKQMIADKSAKECQEIYLKYIAINQQTNLEELTMGLLVAILLEPDKSSDYYRDVVTLSKDNLTLFGSYLNMIIIERVSKVSEQTLKQIFWVANQLMKAGANVAESTCSNLIRQTAGGDLSPRNLSMIENLIDLLIANRNWLINSTSFMGPTVIYNFMRLLSDHMLPAQAALRQREIDFVIGLIKEKIDFVQNIGKDFLRLLHNLLKIPEFEKLHQDIYNNPKSLNPKYEGPQQLLAVRTPRRLFQSCLTFDMERKISFLATHVKFGNQKRYQDWFHRQYFSSPESLSLRCDLIRYICTIIHPSNEVLCSDIIPRWAIIGWLLTTCTTSASAASSKQALFFDWFAYDAKTDNIMNIEPAILVMYYSLRSHPNVTASLLDYLCRIPSSFSPKLSDNIRAGIKKSLQQILEKRVIQSLAPLFDNPKHDPGLRALIRENFPEFCVHHPANDNGLISNAPAGAVAAATILTASQQASLAIAPESTPPSTPIPQQKQPEVIVIDDTKSNDAFVSYDRKPSIDMNHVSANLEAIPQQANKQNNDCTKSKSNSSITIDLEDPPITIPHPNSKHTHDSNRNRKSSDASNDIVFENKRLPDLSGNNCDQILAGAALKDRDGVNLETGDQYLASDYTNSMCYDYFESAVEPTRVIYPFMNIKRTVSRETIKEFNETIGDILEDLSTEKSNETRCTLMDKFISALFDLKDNSVNQGLLDDLACCIAELVADDFTTRIFPSTSQDNESLEDSIATPLFVLCRSAFTSSKIMNRPILLLASVYKVFEATGFLVLYFLRVNLLVNNATFAPNYVSFCEATKRDTTKCLYEDLHMASIYDSEMFCFILPTIFGELATSGAFPVTNNRDIIHLVVSSIDPNYLHELVCLCLTGTARVLSRENPLPVIESSLEWESWEQYCLWKLITAQTVPIETYIQLLPRLTGKAHPEAMTCIMLNLQKIYEPDTNVIDHVIESYSKRNEQFISAILRYWSIKTDVKELTKKIISLFDSPPSSPQVKRKGQAPKTPTKNANLSSKCEKLLMCLECIRLRAPRNKFFSQPELLEKLSQMEPLCNEIQRKKFADLFSIRLKATKKKKMEKEA